MAAPELLPLIGGFRATQAVYVMAKLGLADPLVDDPRTASELAAPAGADLPSLYRRMRALATLGLLAEDAQRRLDSRRSGLPC